VLDAQQAFADFESEPRLPVPDELPLPEELPIVPVVPEALGLALECELPGLLLEPDALGLLLEPEVLGLLLEPELLGLLLEAEPLGAIAVELEEGDELLWPEVLSLLEPELLPIALCEEPLLLPRFDEAEAPGGQGFVPVVEELEEGLPLPVDGLADGVLELVPCAHTVGARASNPTAAAVRKGGFLRMPCE